MISGTRYAIEIQELSSRVAPIAPEISRIDELVIWISSTAINAPSIPPSVPIHARVETISSAGTGERGDVFIGNGFRGVVGRARQSRTLTFTSVDKPGASRVVRSPSVAGSNTI